jgi:hypothetical protein
MYVYTLRDVFSSVIIHITSALGQAIPKHREINGGWGSQAVGGHMRQSNIDQRLDADLQRGGPQYETLRYDVSRRLPSLPRLSRCYMKEGHSSGGLPSCEPRQPRCLT